MLCTKTVVDSAVFTVTDNCDKDKYTGNIKGKYTGHSVVTK